MDGVLQGEQTGRKTGDLQYLLGEQQGFLYQSVLNGVLRILLVLAEDLIVSFLLNVGAFIAEDGNTAFDLFEVVLSLDIVFFSPRLTISFTMERKWATMRGLSTLFSSGALMRGCSISTA